MILFMPWSSWRPLRGGLVVGHNPDVEMQVQVQVQGQMQVQAQVQVGGGEVPVLGELQQGGVEAVLLHSCGLQAQGHQARPHHIS